MRFNLSRFITSILTGLLLYMLVPASKASSWTDNLKLKGDFRYRHELIDEENKDQRNRHRIRARIGLEATIRYDVKFAFQITSGSSNPVSNNQTLGEGFSTKSAGIDLAYFDWHPCGEDIFHLEGGKFKNPWYKPGKSELVWDSDWNPEGLALHYSTRLNIVDPFANAALLWVEEREADDDVLLLGGQGGLKFNLMRGKIRLTVGTGYFTYTNAKESELFVDFENSFGNTVITEINENDETAVQYYATGFDIWEVFTEIGGKIQKLPISVMGDYVTNSGADDDNMGYLVGLRLGRVKEPGSFAGRYIYHEVEKDAVLGAFTDSDFIGGGTDGTGHEVGLDFCPVKNVKTSATYFINHKGIKDGKNYNRLQLDVCFEF